MKLKRVTLALMRAELLTPFKTALRTVTGIEDLIVMAEAENGTVGYGEAPPTAAITGETLETLPTAAAAIARALLNSACDVLDLERLCAIVGDAVPQNTSAKAAVEIALHDLAARLRGIPLHALWNPQPQSIELVTDLTVSVNPVAGMCRDAERAIARGFTRLKIKVGKNFEEDRRRIAAIHALAKGRAELALDVNQGWNEAQTLTALRELKLEGIELALIEQPVRAADTAALARITQAGLYPILADEAVFSSADAARIFAAGGADMVNIKLMKTAGLSDAARLAALARSNGRKCMQGCMLEGAVSVAAAAHFAAAHSDTIRWIDLDGPALCRTNPVRGGTRFDDAHIRLNTTPGLGITAIDNLEILGAIE